MFACLEDTAHPLEENIRKKAKFLQSLFVLLWDLVIPVPCHLLLKKANTALQLGRTTWIKPEHRPSTVSSLNHKYKGEKGFCESYHEMIILAVKVHNFFKLVQIFWSKENLVKNHNLRDASLPLHCMLGNMYSTLYILTLNNMEEKKV